MRSLLALAALPVLTTFAPYGLYKEPVPPSRPVVHFVPVPLNSESPRQRRLGDLVYVGGWAISSNDARFGGISAMNVEDGELLAISDAGSVIRFPLPPGASADLSLKRLVDGPGDPNNKLDRDTEAMAVHGSHVWIAFENLNVIWRYARDNWNGVAHAAPPEMEGWPGNRGSEAMVRLPGGGFLVFSESERLPDGSTAVLFFKGDPTLPDTPVVTLGYRAPDGYQITDAAILPDGRLLFLNRQFSIFDGLSAKLAVGEVGDLNAGTILSGTEIAHLAAPITVDNMEALSVAREGGETIVWLASDDNFSAIQRTLLLKFALAGGEAKAPRP